MKRIILDQALSLLCAGILMFGIPFACNGVILPIVIMEEIVLFNTVLLYPIALFLPLDLILGPRTEEAFFSRRALTRKDLRRLCGSYVYGISNQKRFFLLDYSETLLQEIQDLSGLPIIDHRPEQLK